MDYTFTCSDMTTPVPGVRFRPAPGLGTAHSVLWLLVYLFIGTVNAQHLLSNGSFEEGDATPKGWSARARGTVASGNAHSGGRYLTGNAGRRATVWESDPVAITPRTDYRLEG